MIPSDIQTHRRAMREGGRAARALIEECLARIERLDPELGAFEETYPERSLERAEAVDRGEVTGPLAGLPVAVKDNLCTQWGRTTASSRMLEHFRAPYTATAVERLEAHGAIVVGKTRLDEFAMGSSCEHCAFGATVNPWDRRRVPGGSSGGSAAAVGAGLVPLALGSDTGGSIRQPAAFCGVVGMKPTDGRVSRHGLIAFASSLDQVGPLARTVEDAAHLLEAIAGHDPRDATSAGEQAAPLAEALDQPVLPLRVGVVRGAAGADRNHPAVTEAVNRAVGHFEALGAEVLDIELPHAEYGIPTYYLVAPAEASSNLARYDGVHYGHRSDRSGDLESLVRESRAEGFGPEVRRRILIGTFALSSGYHEAYYLRALKMRRLIKRDHDEAFKRCDVLLSPTTPTPAFEAGENMDDPVAMYMNDIYTVGAPLAGLPAISLPAGFARDASRPLPVGVQLVGPAFSENRLLRIARMLEAAIDLDPAESPEIFA